MHALVASTATGAAKVRWNACYALGSALSNEGLFAAGPEWTVRISPEHYFKLLHFHVSMQTAAYQSLARAITTSPNFKVRINAAGALAAPTGRHLVHSSAMLVEMIQVLNVFACICRYFINCNRPSYLRSAIRRGQRFQTSNISPLSMRRSATSDVI